MRRRWFSRSHGHRPVRGRLPRQIGAHPAPHASRYLAGAPRDPPDGRRCACLRWRARRSRLDQRRTRLRSSGADRFRSSHRALKSHAGIDRRPQTREVVPYLPKLLDIAAGREVWGVALRRDRLGIYLADSSRMAASFGGSNVFAPSLQAAPAALRATVGDRRPGGRDSGWPSWRSCRRGMLVDRGARRIRHPGSSTVLASSTSLGHTAQVSRRHRQGNRDGPIVVHDVEFVVTHGGRPPDEP